MSWNCPFLFAESTIPIAVIHDVKEKCAGFPHIPFGLMICFAIISETWLFASGFWVEIPFEVELVLGMYWTEGSETLMNVTKKYLSSVQKGYSVLIVVQLESSFQIMLK